MAVKARGSQRGGIGERRFVDLCTRFDQELDNGEIASCRRAPNGGSSVNGFAIESDGSNLLYVRFALLYQVLDYIDVAIPAREAKLQV